MSKNKGITLIALIIMIIVLLILAGVSIAMLTGESGVITQAQKAKTMTELSGYKEQLKLYKSEKLAENQEFLDTTLTAGKSGLMYNTQPQGEIGTIKTIINNISDEYLEKLEVQKGELLINTKDKEEIKVAQSLGIEVNPYDITEEGELLSSNGNLLLVDENGTLTIPASITKIGEGAFANCSGLKTIIIPGSVKEIGNNAFAYNATLETVIMQEGVEVIGENAFYYCLKLQNVSMPNSLKNINHQAFMMNHKLERVEIPPNIKEIGEYSFSGCITLKEVILPNGLNEIKNGAFRSTNFSKIVIPGSVNIIEDNVFTDNNNLNNIIIEGQEPKFIYENGLLMTKEKDKILFASDKQLKSVSTFEIPEGVYRFNLDLNKYKNITKLIIPTSLNELLSPRALPNTIQDIDVKVGNNKFRIDKNKKILYTEDSKILNICFSKEENIDLRDENNEFNIQSLSDGAFWPAINAKNITLPKSLKSISSFVFQNCTKIESLRIGENVSYINGLFKYQNYSGQVVIDENNAIYKVENNILYTKDKSELICALYRIIGTLTVDSEVTSIGDSAFHNQYQMTDIILPKGLKNIKNSFGFCQSLKEISIPSTIESIKSNAFTYCENLSSINVQKPKDSIAGAPWGAPKGMKVVNWKQ